MDPSASRSSNTTAQASSAAPRMASPSTSPARSRQATSPDRSPERRARSKARSEHRGQECYLQSWFRYAYGRAETDSDACTLAAVDQKFKSGGYKVKDLIHALTQTDAFLYRKFVPAGGAQ